MNKRILISLSVIGAVAAIAIGGTIAYFSDTETSTGNTFTAGAIDLTIDNESYVTNENGQLVASTLTSWQLKDLESGDLFFNFSDLKPGDVGEDTISLHVDSNDAWACMNVNITGTLENDVTEPEGIIDTTIQANEGELQNELNFAFWADDGDNVYEVGEVIFEQGTAADLFDGVNMVLADSTGNVWNSQGPLQGGGDTAPYVYYVGKVWCYGALTEDPATEGSDDPVTRGTTGFICDGSSVTNVSQTDGITADVTFYAEQSRNNPNFRCVQPVITRIDRTQVGYGDGGWAGWSCPAGTTAIGGGIVSSINPVGGHGVAAPGFPVVDTFDYPTYPHHIYNPPETGYVVHDLPGDSLGNTISFYVDCQTN